ncbi:MAG: hypothetical protein E5W38_01675 [Mesorhizobium sp.]|nr:MAG: hypothetical protein E5W38_01675 [Mesorhizobium sp.]
MTLTMRVIPRNHIRDTMLTICFIYEFLHFPIAIRPIRAHGANRGTNRPRKEGFPMQREFPDQMRDDAHRKVQEALQANGIVNIISLSEEIRLRNLEENFAREDIEDLVMQVAQIYGAPIEFDEQVLTALDLNDAWPGDRRNDLEKALDQRRLPGSPIDLLHLDPKG